MIEKIRKKLIQLKNQSFMRSVVILVGGTAVAQAITVLILPIITRIYSPSDFSLLAVFAGILSIISVIACLRYEMAISLPEKDEDAIDLFALSLVCAAIFAFLLFCVVMVWSREISIILRQPKLENYLYLLPLGVFLSSAYSATQYWATRKKNFKGIASTRFKQSISGAVVQIGLGLYGFVPIGLLLGQIINNGAGALSLVKDLLKKDFLLIKSLRLKKIFSVAGTYKQYPQYSTPEALVSIVGIQAPLIIIAAISLGAEAGYLLLASRVMLVPTMLVGKAVALVYTSRVAEEYRNGQLTEFTISTVSGLVKAGVGPFLFIGILSPIVFPLVFGSQWLRAGELALLMTPMLVMQFLSAPISMAMYVKERQRLMFMLTFIGTFFRLSAMGAAVFMGEIQFISEVYIVSGTIFFLICFVTYMNVAGVSVRSLGKVLIQNFIVIISWVLMALLIKLAFGGFAF